MEKIIVIDNYDSFTYNLVHLLKEVSQKDVTVVRNDKFDLAEINNFDKIVLSPGPGVPNEAGLMPELVKRYAATKSILGVCLGHQCIGEVFGAKLINLAVVAHGKSYPTIVTDSTELLFKGIDQEFLSARYHSWAICSENFPDCLKITAEGADKTIMALRHKQYNVAGVQFHPESVMTPVGPEIIKNWLGLA